jgi:hypothetical protein
MQTIDTMKCVYSTTDRTWAIEIGFGADQDARRFSIDGPVEAEMVIEAFTDASAANYDPQTGELHFSYEMRSVEDEEGDEEVAEVDDEEADEEDGEDQRPADRTARKRA